MNKIILLLVLISTSNYQMQAVVKKTPNKKLVISPELQKKVRNIINTKNGRENLIKQIKRIITLAEHPTEKNEKTLRSLGLSISEIEDLEKFLKSKHNKDQIHQGVETIINIIPNQAPTPAPSTPQTPATTSSSSSSGFSLGDVLKYIPNEVQEIILPILTAGITGLYYKLRGRKQENKDKEKEQKLEEKSTETKLEEQKTLAEERGKITDISSQEQLESLIEQKEQELKELQQKRDKLHELTEELVKLYEEKERTYQDKEKSEKINKDIRSKTIERNKLEIEVKTKRIKFEKELAKERDMKNRREVAAVAA